MTNYCIYDCKYCINRISNDVPRARFTPDELADITINFYKRNYIEGLFLSSGIIKNPDYTCEQMIETLSILRNKYKFNGYIHAKAIPGADSELISRLGMLADRMSVNIELPSQKSLNMLAPDKSKHSILLPMQQITTRIKENSTEIVKYKKADKFAPAGQSTQMIIGATPDTDFQILRLSEALYKKYSLKRVFYSAYIPVGDQKLLPPAGTKPPLLREHRLYQADWLIRFYGFESGEILDDKNQNFNPYLDPKCNWAVHNMGLFPVEINKAPYEMLLRVPGIGVNSAKRIITARKSTTLDYPDLKKLGVVLKRAQYFILCSGKLMEGLKISETAVIRQLMSASTVKQLESQGLYLPNDYEQLSFFDSEKHQPTMEDFQKCLTGQI
jgi:putative DNA modification/repair radical SAM protein